MLRSFTYLGYLVPALALGAIAGVEPSAHRLNSPKEPFVLPQAASRADTVWLRGLLLLQWEGVQVVDSGKVAALFARLTPSDSLTLVVPYTHKSGSGLMDAHAASYLFKEYFITHGIDPRHVKNTVELRYRPNIIQNDYPYLNSYLVVRGQ